MNDDEKQQRRLAWAMVAGVIALLIGGSIQAATTAHAVTAHPVAAAGHCVPRAKAGKPGPETDTVTFTSTCGDIAHARAECQAYGGRFWKGGVPNVKGSGKSKVNCGWDNCYWWSWGYSWQHKLHWTKGKLVWTYVQLGKNDSMCED